MYVVAVTVMVKPEHREDFQRAVFENARATRGEPDNLRFDVSQAEEDPNRFLLYEVYRDRAGFEAHQRTAHYLRWREGVKDWMAAPRQGVRHHSLFPADGDW